MAEPARSPTARPVVVVGYDGSPAADAALERGLDRTIPGGRLYVVHAWEPPRVLSGAPYYGIVASGSFERAEAMMDELSERHPRLRGAGASVSVVDGHAPDVIAALAEDVEADEIVVGTHGAGRAGALMGSVAHGLLHTAGCPVTVIPERALRRIDGRRAVV